jgi:hypothetical protein
VECLKLYEVIKAFTDVDGKIKTVGMIITVADNREDKLISQGYIVPLPTALAESYLKQIRDIGLDILADTNGIKAVTDNIPQGITNILENVEGAALNSKTRNYGAITVAFDPLTNGAIGVHKLLEVDGVVRIRFLIECTVDLAGAGATVELGLNSDTDAFILTTTATDIDAGELWVDETPTETYGNYSSIVFDKIINDDDVEYEIKVADITGGELVLHYWWEALNADGDVVPA